MDRVGLNCPLCNSTEFSVVYEQVPEWVGISIVKCGSCLHVYSLARREFNPDKLYDDETYRLVETRKTIFDKILSLEYKRVLTKIDRMNLGKITLLDFGSGKGKFASLVQERGWVVKGVETAKLRAEYAEKVYGLEVNRNFYSGGQVFDIHFNVLTLFHVLEHLPNPIFLLRELMEHNLTKPALVIIEVPHFKSWQSALAGKRWMHLDAFRHISHFTSARLEQAGRELKLRTVKTGFFSFHLGVLGMLDSIFKVFGYRKNMIYQLKNKKGPSLMIMVALCFPFALTLELIAAVAGRGGIVRKYFILDR